MPSKIQKFWAIFVQPDTTVSVLEKAWNELFADKVANLTFLHHIMFYLGIICQNHNPEVQADFFKLLLNKFKLSASAQLNADCLPFGFDKVIIIAIQYDNLAVVSAYQAAGGVVRRSIIDSAKELAHDNAVVTTLIDSLAIIDITPMPSPSPHPSPLSHRNAYFEGPVAGVI